jgi:hypothetical protein
VAVGIWDHIYRGGIQAGNLSTKNANEKTLYEFATCLDADNLMPYTKAALDKFIKLVPELDPILSLTALENEEFIITRRLDTLQISITEQGFNLCRSSFHK